MAHKYYLNKEHLFRDRQQDDLFELVANSTYSKMANQWHVGNSSYGGNTAIKMWKMYEVSLEETISWLLNKKELTHILKEILQQYIDENYKCQ